MKKLIFATAAAIAMTATTAHADQPIDGETTVYVLSAEQQASYDGWPVDRRSAYDAWPPDVQEFYWTLDPDQTAGWWVLTDDQRVRVFKMTPQQRAQAWTAIAAQMGGTNPGAATAPSTAAPTAGPRFVRSEVAQTVAANAVSSDGELPICSETVKDNCMNAWEAGKRGPGVNRPLEYWPGRPASEIDEPLPATRPED